MSNILHDEDLPDHVAAALPLNEDRYRHHLAGRGLNTDEENALLQALWSIMRSFVELGWGVDSVRTMFPDLFTPADVIDGITLEQKAQSVKAQFRNAAQLNGKEASHE